MSNVLLVYSLTKTTRRLTFDIIEQAEAVTYMGDDDGPYFKFVAGNGYEVISRSRMDIQTERLWLLGAKRHEEARSGSMVFSSNEKRDAAYDKFIAAINEWAAANGGEASRVSADASSESPKLNERDVKVTIHSNLLDKRRFIRAKHSPTGLFAEEDYRWDDNHDEVIDRALAKLQKLVNQ